MLSLISGVVLLGVSVALFVVLNWSARRPVQPAWASERWVSLVHAPLVVSLFTFGAAYIVAAVAKYAGA